MRPQYRVPIVEVVDTFTQQEKTGQRSPHRHTVAYATVKVDLDGEEHEVTVHDNTWKPLKAGDTVVVTPGLFGSKAMELYNMAAENGNRQAQENLGYCYYYGRDTEVDYEKAFHYFALGAFDGHLISLYKIGDMYRNGYYVKKNEKEAFLIYKHCIDVLHGGEDDYLISGPVRLRLGDMYLNGIGTKKNPEAALVSYSIAEIDLFRMVKDGDYMYKKSLRAAIEGQERARAQLAEELPEQEWTFDD